MPTNLLKKYPELLDLAALNDFNRNESLMRIFKRDFEENSNLEFRAKKIRPIKGEEPEMQILFRHLTTVEFEEKDDTEKTYRKRIFEINRSRRLHWIKYHLDENKKNNVEIFSVEERVDRGTVIRTYLYDCDQKYVIVLQPQRSGKDYYLLSAYYLDRGYGEKMMKKKLKKKLNELH